MRKKAREARLWQPNLDEVLDDREVLGVGGQQRYAMHVCGRGDHKVESPPARLAAALSDRSMQPPALPGCCRVEGQGVESVLDDAKSADAQSPDIVVSGDQDAEMKLDVEPTPAFSGKLSFNEAFAEGKGTSQRRSLVGGAGVHREGAVGV